MIQGTFTAFSPNWPPRRHLNLWDIIPRINKEEDASEDLERFILCIQDELDVNLATTDNWPDILDSDRAPIKFVDLILRDLGNPFRFEDLSDNDKRLLARTLVPVYRLKGTTRGIQAAIRFFMGFESQVHLFRQTGSLLGKNGPPAVVISRLDDSFVLGGGGPYDFALVVATTDPDGRPLTEVEITRIRRIISVIKAAPDRLMEPIFYGLPAPTKVSITGSAPSVTITWADALVEPTTWRVYHRRTVPGATPFNTAAYTEVDGALRTVTIGTPIGADEPGTVYHFVVVPYYGGKGGFVSTPEVRNGLAAPVGVTATPGPRSVTVSWEPVLGATSYRVYKRLAGASTPTTFDFVSEVMGGGTSFKDRSMLPGLTANYRVVALVGDSEGFYSANVAAAAT